MTSPSNSTTNDNTLRGNDALRFLHYEGAHFTLPRGRTKGQDENGKPTMPKGWQNKPNSLAAALKHANDGGNVGILTGAPSGGLIAIDRDADFLATVAMIADLANTTKVVRSNAPDRGKLLYHFAGELPASTAWKPDPSKDKHPVIELLANGKHAIIPPSQYDGGEYQLNDTQHGIRELTPAELDGIWLMVTGHFFYSTSNQQITQQPKSVESISDYKDKVKAAWPLMSIFEHFGRTAAGVRDLPHGERRITDNGGLQINGELWYCFADGLGGDALDAWAWCTDGKRLDRGNSKAFWEVLNGMADAAGIPPLEREAAKAKVIDAIESGADDDETDPPQPKWTVSKKIADDLASWGYDLWLNDMDDSVWNGSRQMDDAQRAQLRVRARDEGYAKHKLMGALDDAILAIAADRRKHPIREYLATLQWDGKDHVAALASYITDRHDVIVYPDGTVRTVVHAFLYRWLISAVAKIHGDANAARDNKILVFAAEQGKGKSHLAGWLCPLLEFFVERHINPDDKDVSLLRARAWVWEIGELGATTRRADVEALKAHVTASSITERKAYGHFDTKKPTIASYVGTVNPDGVGFLTDPTGSRRFSVVEISDIDWEYATAVDVNQLWGQAMHLWRMDPRSYRYTPEEVATQTVNANEHTETDPYGDMIASTFEIDANDASTSLSSTEALHYLRTYAGLSHGNDRQAGRELARALRRYWSITGRRSNGRTVYQGLRLAGKWSAKVNSAEDAITAAGI